MDFNEDESQIKLITGCMFAGKTTELIRRVKLFERGGNRVLCIKPSTDDRYSSKMITTHDQTKYPAAVVDTDKPEQIIDLYEQEDYEVIAIDECNLFEDSLVDVIRELEEEASTILLAGLDRDFRGDPFSPVDKLAAISTEVIKKYDVICEECNNKASRTQRLVNGNPVHADEDTILVGGNESYEPRCKKCHTVPRD